MRTNQSSTSTQQGSASSLWKVTADKKEASRRNLSCCFQSWFWLFAWLQKWLQVITFWEIPFTFHMRGGKRHLCSSFSCFSSYDLGLVFCGFFFCEDHFKMNDLKKSQQAMTSPLPPTQKNAGGSQVNKKTHRIQAYPVRQKPASLNRWSSTHH